MLSKTHLSWPQQIVLTLQGRECYVFHDVTITHTKKKDSPSTTEARAWLVLREIFFAVNHDTTVAVPPPYTQLSLLVPHELSASLVTWTSWTPKTFVVLRGHSALQILPPPHPRVRHDTKRTMAKGILFALEGSLCMPSISFLVNGSKPSVALHLIRRTFLHFFLLQVMNLQTLQLAVHCSGLLKSFLTFLISASAPLAFTFNTPFLQGSYLFLVPISP